MQVIGQPPIQFFIGGSTVKQGQPIAFLRIYRARAVWSFCFHTTFEPVIRAVAGHQQFSFLMATTGAAVDKITMEITGTH
jgi:hypothetical protein